MDGGRQPATSRQLEVRIYNGSIVDVPSPAYVLGVFDNVNPTGTARAVDAVLGGTLSQLVQDRMFGSRMGEIFLLPTPRQRTLSEMIVFIGLGPLDSFRPQILELTAENLARVVTAARLHSFATVPIGSNAGLSVAQSLQSFSAGFLRGLRRSDSDNEFRSIQVCELDPTRYQALESGLVEHVAKGYFTSLGVDVSVRKSTIKEVARSRSIIAPAPAEDTIDPLYLQIRTRQSVTTGDSVLEYSVLTADLDAAIQRYERTLTAQVRQEAGAKLSRATQIDAALGQAMTDYYMPPETRDLMRAQLEKKKDRPVVVIHDAGSSVVPWEVLFYGNECPAIEAGVSRKFVVQSSRVGGRSNLPPETPLKALVVANPTGDLRGADKEGEMLRGLFSQQNGQVKVLGREEATKRSIIEELSTSEYDILHYAGHAMFAKNNPAASGIQCADGLLTSADIASTVFAPQLVFLNGCESARVRGEAKRSPTQALFTDFERNVSLAELILTGGVRNFIGTYWPVDDEAALQLSRSLYESLLGGKALGPALCIARKKVRAIHDKDWANYLHFGNPSYRLRRM